MTAVNNKAAFTMTHVCDAPKELVFNAFSTAEALNEWWGPADTSNSVITLDFRPGGIFHFRMESGEHVMYGRFLFRTIQPYDLLEFTNGFADEHGRVVRAPFDPSFPLEILYRFTFTEDNGRTTIHLTGVPFNTNEEGTAAFKALDESMQEGFGGTFRQLDNYLREIQHP